MELELTKIKLCKELKKIISDNEEIETSLLYDHVLSCFECKQMSYSILDHVRNQFPIIKMIITTEMLNKLKG